MNAEQVLNPSWPDATWNISGLFAHDKLLWTFIELVKKYCDGDCPIKAVHGSFPFRWNGGRIVQRPFMTSIEMIRIFQRYANLGINVYLTFSNHLIEKRDLDDYTCNFLLEKLSASEGSNGVIISSEILNDYIRERFPNLVRVASCVKAIIEEGKHRADFYRGLKHRYDKYVLEPDDNLDVSFVSSLGADRVEILVNEPCLVGCANRRHHFDLVARKSRDPFNLEFEDDLRRVQAQCKALPLQKQADLLDGQRSCRLTPQELKKLYDIGCRDFKLQGRNFGSRLFLYDLSHYLLETDFFAPRIFMSLASSDL